MKRDTSARVCVIGARPSGITAGWPLSDAHAKLAANFIMGSYTPPPDMRQQIAKEVEHIRTHYVKSARHTIEVDYHQHLKALLREIPANAPAWSKAEVS